MISFDHAGRAITNLCESECGRFAVSREHYGFAVDGKSALSGKLLTHCCLVYDAIPMMASADHLPAAKPIDRWPM